MSSNTDPTDPSSPDKTLSPAKQALLSLRKMQARLHAWEAAAREPIAIVGMGCRMPGGADTPDQFWDLLCQGRDTAAEIPKERWDIDAYYDPNSRRPAAGKITTRQAHFIPNVDQFDPRFFNISPREACSMDPQQRLLLEISWEAIESAGYSASKLRDSKSGVFIGIISNDYARLTSSVLEEINRFTDLGQMNSVAAGRLAYLLGLRGPALAVDTACSSSLVAIHLAVNSLRLRECDMALAGGVDLVLTPHPLVMATQVRALSPDGRCKTFDASADGYGRGEGAGMILLKRLSDAIAGDDRILALIRGSAINHDGATSSLTVPNGHAQEAVIRAALENGGLSPDDVSFIEAHGSGTRLGDPIELEALHAVFGERPDPLTVGSVKTNIGHLEAAAGISGILKVVLALMHREIPAHLHFREPNPNFSPGQFPFNVNTAHAPWRLPKPLEERVAGISSFGFSGTNAHVVLSEAPESSPDPQTSTGAESSNVLCLSGKTRTALADQCRRWTDHLTANPDLRLRDICFTANAGRVHFDVRLGIVAESSAGLRETLRRISESTDPPNTETVGTDTLNGRYDPDACYGQSKDRPRLAFIFPGSSRAAGAQGVGAGHSSYLDEPAFPQGTDAGHPSYFNEPAFRQALERCQEILRPHTDVPLLSILGPEASGAGLLLEQAEYAQPSLFVSEYALAELWASWGLQPDIVMGQGIGEYVAACVAGVFSLEDALKLVSARGRSMASDPRNGAGETMPRSFRQVAEEIVYRRPELELVSNLTARITDGEIATADYWCDQAAHPLRLEESLTFLRDQGYRLFVEVGRSPRLAEVARSCLGADIKDGRARWLSSLPPVSGDVGILRSLTALYVEGATVNWEAFFSGARAGRKILLPTYPFQRERHWV